MNRRRIDCLRVREGEFHLLLGLATVVGLVGTGYFLAFGEELTAVFR